LPARARKGLVAAFYFLTSVAAGAGVGLGLFLSPLLLTPADCLLPNVRIEEYPVAGCRIEATRRFLREAPPPARLWIKTPTRTWSVKLSEVGGKLLIDEAVDEASGRRDAGEVGLLDRGLERWDAVVHGRQVNVRTAWNTRKLHEYLCKLAWATNVSPRNAELRRVNGTFLLGRGAPGRRMDLDATVRKIVREYGPNHRQFRAVYVALPPHISAADLRCSFELLGSFTTRFPAYKRNRTRNLTLALRKLRGAVVLPGETFSFNRRVGERTRKTGFVVADIFVNHEVVPGLGGGVCQVSTTLYNAARRAKIKVVERHRHSLPVTYVAVGRDATVAYGGRDLKLRNNTPNPLYIDGRIKGSALTVELWGSRRPRAAGGAVEASATMHSAVASPPSPASTTPRRAS